ncbi:DUF5715 family protein [Odoribacter sp. OttesenSCG-928-J03]|nr:DUF5715 family protein [Odoribacter sp. OttesenSCG-928-J03]MDL2283407.1 DUF5715 family protein [Odoribacter sp. OttesenSCG-928-G04]
MRFSIIIFLLLLITAGCKEEKKTRFKYFKNYSATFNDMNHKHLEAAKRLGINPCCSIDDNKDKNKLLKVTSCNLFEVDKLTHSYPYLVAPAYRLLVNIGKNFQDSLSRKKLPAYGLVVTSILRTDESVGKLQKNNINASNNSAHRYGTTFDIAYARFKKHSFKEAEYDKLKSVLAEVLHDLQKAKRCYIRYEYKQGCFHITTRS